MLAWSVYSRSRREKLRLRGRLDWSEWQWLFGSTDSLTTGYRRIRSLESHVSDIRVTQGSIQNALSEILGHIRGGNSLNRSAVTQFSQTNYNRSPSLQSMGSPPMAQTPTGETFLSLYVCSAVYSHIHSCRPPCAATSCHCTSTAKWRTTTPNVTTSSRPAECQCRSISPPARFASIQRECPTVI